MKQGQPLPGSGPDRREGRGPRDSAELGSRDTIWADGRTTEGIGAACA